MQNKDSYADDTCSVTYTPVTQDDMLADLMRSIALLDDDSPVYSSDLSINMEKEYVFQNYRRLRQENSPRCGVEKADDVRIQPLYFDELCYLLQAEGTHPILFGGPWDEKTQSVIDRIQYAAAQHGVDTVYQFDFRLDSDRPETSIKADLTAQAGYNGPGKKPAISAADHNFLYGELLSRFLTNADDWADPAWGRITWLNARQDLLSVPDLQEPFLFLYNRDNPVDHSGRHAASGRFPIISALHLDPVCGADGTLQADGADVDSLLEERIFRYVDADSLTPFTHQDYLYEAFRQNTRGHSAKTEDCFREGEQINICPVTFAELYWLLKQKGTFLILLCSAWCGNSQAAVATINDYAVANGVRVYMLDNRVDGNYPIDFWGYPRGSQLALTHPCFLEKYFEIWETGLVGAPLLCTNAGHTKGASLLQTFVDADGEEHRLYPVNIPWFAAVDKDHIDEYGRRIPVLAACNHEGIELLSYKKTFVYYKPNYQRYCSGVYAVIHAFCESAGREMQDKTIDRTAPLLEGSPAAAPVTGETAPRKEHNWQLEMDPDGIPYPWALASPGQSV